MPICIGPKEMRKSLKEKLRLPLTEFENVYKRCI